MPVRRVVAIGLVAVHGLALGFEAKVTEPAFTISVPSLPNIPLRQQAQAAPSAPRLIGGDGTYEVTVVLTAMAKPVSARECAGSGLRSILARPGLPSRDSIYRAPLSASTFLVIYVAPGGVQPVLHAHLLAAPAGTHCTEVHFSRQERPGEDADGWRRTFADARIE